MKTGQAWSVPCPSARYSALRISSRRLTVRWNSKLPSPGGIKAGGLGIRCGEQLHAMLVERVDQGHEARRLVAHFAGHYRNSDDDDGVEPLGDGEIVGCAPRLTHSRLNEKTATPFRLLGTCSFRPPPTSSSSVGTLARSSTG